MMSSFYLHKENSHGSSQSQKSRVGVLRWPRYQHHCAVAQAKLWQPRSHLLLLQHWSRRRTRRSRSQGFGQWRIEVLRRRFTRRVCARLSLPVGAIRRQLRAFVFARYLSSAPFDCQAPSRNRLARRCRRPLSRLYRQRQRPSTFRIDLHGDRSSAQSHRSVARVEYSLSRRCPRLRRRAQRACVSHH